MNRRLVVAMSCVVTMAVLSWATAIYGIGASTDTVTYLSVAQNVLKGNGFVSYDGGVMVEFPPVYPLLISVALYLLPVPALSAVKLLSVLSAGGCSSAAAYLLQRYLRYSVARWAGLVLILLSVPLWSVYVMGWSEPPFIFFTLLLFIMLARYLQVPSTKRLLCIAGVSSLCILTRYTGVVSAMAGAVGIGWTPLSCRRTRLTHVVLYCLLVFGALGVWLIRNLAVSGTLVGERVPSEQGFLWNLETCCRVVDRWFLPGASVPIFLLLPLGAVLIFTQSPRPFSEPLRLQVLFIFYAAAYLMLLVLSASKMAYDELDNRLLAPMYVPLLLALLGIGETVYSRFLSDVWFRWLATALVILFALSPVFTTLDLLQEVRQTGVDFTSERWWKSSSLAFLRQHTPNVPLYSNCPEAIYLHTGRVAYLLPRRFYYATHLPVREDVRDFEAEIQEKGLAYLLWFPSEPTDYLYSPRQLASFVTLHLERHFTDADLFRVTPRTAPLEGGP
ncbi:MAG: hypothetical protein KatS3mg022_0055 [Armatimonadota bacterium]|nr:MAG: hypothetical protein KatS3mg022_0055 [Armatimonadota bacterium]